MGLSLSLNWVGSKKPPARVLARGKDVSDWGEVTSSSDHGCRSSHGTAACVDVAGSTAQANPQARDAEATEVKAGAMLTSNKGGVVSDEVFVTQRFVDRVAVPLDLNDHGVGVSGEGSFDVQLDGAG